MPNPPENDMNDKEKAIAGDPNKLANDAKAASDEGATPLADKVRGLHDKGIAAIDKMADSYEVVQARAARVKSQAAATNAFIQENPWRSTLIAGLLGVLAGVAIARR